MADDFGLDTELGLTKKLPLGFDVSVGAGFRACDNWRSVERWDASLSLGYKVCSFLKAEAGYTYLYNQKGEERTRVYKPAIPAYDNWTGYNVDRPYWRSKNRFTLSLTGSHNVGRFEFSLREMVQLTRYVATSTTEEKWRFENPADKENLKMTKSETDLKPAKTKDFLRSRLAVRYNIRKCPLEPYVSYELSNNLREGFSLDKRRVSAGTRIKLSKRQRLSIGYVYDNGADDDSEGNTHRLSLGYTYKF